MSSRGVLGRVLLLGLAAFATRSAGAAVGDLDPSFGTGGMVVSQLGLSAAPQSSAAGVLLLPDGRLVVAGHSSDLAGHNALTLVRYLPAGGFDSSFGADGSGVVRTQLGAGPTPGVGLASNPLARAPDGSLVVCGQASDASGKPQILVARYTEAGALDPSFASGGKFVLQLLVPSGAASGLLGCTVQPDGRVVGAGFRHDGGVAIDAVALRLDTLGVLDPGFASGGLFVQNLALGSSKFSDLTDALILPDGSIVVVVEGKDASGSNGVGVGAIAGGGTFLPGFGLSGGYTLLSIGGNAFGAGVVRQPDGRLVVGGTAGDGSGHSGMLATRFTVVGAPDPSFGNGGSRIVQPSAAATPQSDALAIVQQPSGRILLVGAAADTTGGTQLAIARLTRDGALDPSFGGTGIVLKQFASGTSPKTFGTSAVFTPEGKLVVAGHTEAGTTTTWFVASFIADLPPVPAFAVAPAAPVVGDSIALDASGSNDPDGQVASVAWDLDGDGAYDDAAGTTTTVSFDTAASHVVGVAVTDDDGVRAASTQAIAVGCGTAATALSIDCRLGALVASIDGGVAPGRTQDRLVRALERVRTIVAFAARVGGKKARRAAAKARSELAGFAGKVRGAGRDVSRDLRGELFAGVRDVRRAIKQFGSG